VRYPAVTEWQAVQFCSAGVRISYAQLLDAANNMVLGVEIWAQVQRDLRIRTDISADAVAVCCDSRLPYGVSGLLCNVDALACGPQMTS
jgi:hypothetical protein